MYICYSIYVIVMIRYSEFGEHMFLFKPTLFFLRSLRLTDASHSSYTRLFTQLAHDAFHMNFLILTRAQNL